VSDCHAIASWKRRYWVTQGKVAAAKAVGYPVCSPHWPIDTLTPRLSIFRSLSYFSLSLYVSLSVSVSLSCPPTPSPVDVVEKVTPDSPINLGPESEGKDTASINVATQVTGERHGHNTLHGLHCTGHCASTSTDAR
jgi:hypothetical protein